MDILEKHYIAIDAWSVLYPEKTTFLLSHLHTDHADIPKTFGFPVYASEATAVFNVHKRIRPVLRVDAWYRTHKYHIPFRVLKTMHTVESIGFYFPSLAVLYMGDSIDSIIPMIPRPLTIIYDGLYEETTRMLPAVSQTCAMIRRALDSTCPVVQIVHHGILSFIAESCQISFRLHPSVPDLVRTAATHLQLVDDASPYLMVGRSYKDDHHIVPSSYWFMRDPRLDPFSVHADGNKFRVFCTLHASAADIATWKDRHPYAQFEALQTNAV